MKFVKSIRISQPRCLAALRQSTPLGGGLVLVLLILHVIALRLGFSLLQLHLKFFDRHFLKVRLSCRCRAHDDDLQTGGRIHRGYFDGLADLFVLDINLSSRTSSLIRVFAAVLWLMRHA